MQKINFVNYKLKPETKSRLQSFQELALEVIKIYGIRKQYAVIKNGRRSIINGHAIIFKFAKRNKSYLEGKLALCREKFGQNTEGKAGYLLALLLKQPPWTK